MVVKGNPPILAIVASVIALCLLAIIIQIVNSHRSVGPTDRQPPPQVDTGHPKP